MKVKFWCDSGANAFACKTEVLDTAKDLGLQEGEWEQMDDDAKHELAMEWAWNSGLDVGVGEAE